MQNTASLQFSAATDGRELRLDADCVLVSATQSFGGSSRAVISRDPKTTIANSVTAPGNGIDENIIGIVGAAYCEFTPGVPIPAGQSVFVSVNALMTLCLQFELTL